MKKLIILTTILFSQSLLACGSYQLTGLVTLEKGDTVITINPKTKSELKFIVKELQNSATLLKFTDKYMTAVATISKKLDGTEGEIDSLKDIKPFFPDFLRQGYGTELKQISKSSCKK